MGKVKEFNMKKLGKKLLYWSNCCGDLHHHGEYDMVEEVLTEDLKRAYRDLWSDDYGSYCYLVEYKGKNGIALINEYDGYDAFDLNLTMDDLYLFMKMKAEKYSKMKEFESAKIICGRTMNPTMEDHHELIVVLPCYVLRETIDKIARILFDTAYEEEY